MDSVKGLPSWGTVVGLPSWWTVVSLLVGNVLKAYKMDSVIGVLVAKSCSLQQSHDWVPSWRSLIRLWLMCHFITWPCKPMKLKVYMPTCKVFPNPILWARIQPNPALFVNLLMLSTRLSYKKRIPPIWKRRRGKKKTEIEEIFILIYFNY